jgi:hypothetical protein
MIDEDAQRHNLFLAPNFYILLDNIRIYLGNVETDATIASKLYHEHGCFVSSFVLLEISYMHSNTQYAAP